MANDFFNQTAAFFYALLVHILALSVLFLGVGLEFKRDESAQDCLVAGSIYAETISAAEVNAALEHMQQQQQVEQNREHTLQRQAQALNQQRQKLEEWQQQQTAQQSQAEQRMEQLQKKLAHKQAELEQQLAQAKAQQQALEQRQAEVALREAELQKAAQQQQAEQARLQAQAEQQRQAAEQERAEQARQQRLRAEQQRHEEAEQQRQAKAAEQRRREEARIRAAAEAATQAKIEAAAKAEAAAQAARDQQQIRSTVVAIQSKTSRHWIQPVGLSNNLSCMLDIRTIPSGEVLNVRVVRSSGNNIFDDSAEAAIWSASPLPVPADKALFEKHFRHFRFNFRPQ